MKLVTLQRTPLLLALLLATACGDDSGAPSAVDGFDPRLRGIYTLDTHSKNVAACQAGGEEIEHRHTLFAIDTIDFHGRYLLGALSCADEAMCRSHIDEAQAPGSTDQIPELDVDFFVLFTGSRSDGSAWSKAEGTTAVGDGTCTAELFDDQIFHAESQVSIESRITSVPAFPVDSDGACVIPSEARTVQCTAFELVSGTLSQTL